MVGAQMKGEEFLQELVRWQRTWAIPRRNRRSKMYRPKNTEWKEDQWELEGKDWLHFGLDECLQE